MSELILLCAGAAIDSPKGAAADAPPADLFSAHAPEFIASLRASAFARRFARARPASDVSDEGALPRELPDEAWLRRRFGIPQGDCVSAWAALTYGLALPRWRATPVHVEVGRYQIVLADPRSLQLDAGEAAGLAEAARPALQAAGFTLEIGSSQDWFLAGNPDWALDTHAWTMAVGRSIDGYLPDGARARDWRRVFTEVQMAWHEHPVNEQRAARRLPPINALWLDGQAGGPLPSRRLTVFTDEASIGGLALGAGARLLASTQLSNALVPAAADGDVLVDLGLWRAPRMCGDLYEWRQAWTAFESWLGSLPGHRALPAGFDRLRLVASGERRCVELELGAADRLRWWRRLDAAAALLQPT